MKSNRDYVRSSVFGFEDALVSTTGVVIGITIGAASRQFILLAGFVTIAVEAISMAAGQYLSERTMHELEPAKHKDSLLLGSGIMLISYFLGGLVPLFPVILLSPPLSTIFVLVASAAGLFTLGFVKGRYVKISPTKSALEMLFVGGFATLVGVIAGYLLKT